MHLDIVFRRAELPEPINQVSILPRGFQARAIPFLVPGAFRNPVLDGDFPDPGVLRAGDVYYAYATNASGQHIQVARSRDLVQWQRLDDAFPRLPAWAVQRQGWNWAPAVAPVGNHFCMYLTVRTRVGRREMQCIIAAIADRPEGPFECIGTEPLICQPEAGGAIDPSVFRDRDGTRYLLWKSDANSMGRQTWIHIQPLAADGLALAGRPQRLIANNQAWEGHLVEAPTLWEHAGQYILFYSASNFANARYAIGYALADRPQGPFFKAAGPFFATDPARGIVGPGGQDLVIGPDGNTYLIYHAWSGDCRRLHVDRLDWKTPDPCPEATPRWNALRSLNATGD